jgi:hypothetical protein
MENFSDKDSRDEPISKLTQSRFTFGLANVQWIFLNWGQQFSTWQKSLLAIFNWFLFFGMSNLKEILSCLLCKCD